MSETALCELCGEPMPEGEEMFKFHGYSGNCPKPPLPKKSEGAETLDTIATQAATIATQAVQIEAIKKLRDQYASQAKFADIDCAVHFRDFVRRIDAALAAVGNKHD